MQWAALGMVRGIDQCAGWKETHVKERMWRESLRLDLMTARVEGVPQATNCAPGWGRLKQLLSPTGQAEAQRWHERGDNGS